MMKRDCGIPKSEAATEIARKLRSRSTKAEAFLWRFLRGKKMAGAKFRRQHPIGNYVVDFFCFELGLVIEVDGETHAARRGEDRKRQEVLESMGLKILRFTDAQVLYSTDAVLDRIGKDISEGRQSQAGRGVSKILPPISLRPGEKGCL